MAEADDNQIPFKPYILRAMIDWCEDNGNDEFRFDARFGEASRQIVLPVRAIIAAYPAEHPESAIGFPYEPPTAAPEAPEATSASAKRPTLIQKIK